MIAGWLRRWQVTSFFVVACAFSWTAWAPLALAPGRAEPGTTLYSLHFVGALGPMLAALVMSGLGGRRSHRRFYQRLSPRRSPAAWIAVAGTIPPGLYFVTGAALAVLGPGEIDPAGLGRFDELPGLVPPVAWVILFLTYGAGEEFGWRGWLLPRLQRTRTPFSATLLLIPIWAAWHLPLFFYDPGLASLGALGMLGWLVSLGAGALLLTWLFNASGGSALVAAVFHASTNVVFMSDVGAGPAGNIAGMSFVVLALVVLVTTRLRLGRERPSSAGDAVL